MVKIDIYNLKRVYFIGIGGISMSALAKILINLGINVSGSDLKESEQTEELSKLSATIYIGENANNLKNNIDLVVYTGAVQKTNKEYQKALKLGLPIVERSEFLGAVANMYNNVISIGGTHGKTTTTALIGEIYNNAKKSPTIHIGGVASFGNLQVGDREVFITEACEYLNSFAHLNSSTVLITNIEADHLDYYRNLDEIKKAFLNFANNSNKYVITFENDWIFGKLNKFVTYYSCGFDEKYDFYAYNIDAFNGGYTFDVKFQGEFLGRFIIKIPGIHNVKNALCAIATTYVNGISLDIISKSIYEFKGVGRRYELIGEIDGAKIIADYAHHPTEILNSISAFKGKKVLCVFQPHTYSRTKALKKEFSTAFNAAKKLIIYKTYPAREEYMKEGSEEALFKSCQHKNKELVLEKEVLINMLKAECKNFDIVLVLGAGDIYKIVKNGL